MKRQRVTVLQTIRQGKIGGGESHVLSLISMIDTARFRPVVLSFTEGEMVDVLLKMGITVYVIPTTKPFNLFVINKVASIIKKEKVELIHSHGTRATSNTFYAAKQTKIPIIYTVHAWSFHPSLHSLSFKVRVFFEKLLTEKVNLTICVSNVNQQEGIRLFRLNNSKVIPNGVDLHKFNYQEEFSDVRHEFGIPKERFLVGYIVRMNKQKDPITLLRAVKKVVLSNKNISFLFVGEGDLKAEMEKFIKKNNLCDSIFFKGFRTDIPRILSSIDVYVLPSLWEGLPIGVLEAMAMEKKIIVSDAEANKELIANNDNGIVFQRQDVDGLASSILRMYQDSIKAKGMAIKARKVVYQKYDLQNMVREIERTYFDLILKK